jgi:hypothetical protein
VLRHFAPVVGVGLGLAMAIALTPAAHAQTDIDQGKPASELFANYCAVCHKTTRGLANGKSALTISLFLREHYASSREQAAALAAYVISAGGNAPAPAAKPERARIEEPKGQEPKGQEPKGQEPKGQEPKVQETKGHEPKLHPTAALGRPEPEKPVRQPGQEEAKPAETETAPIATAPTQSQMPGSVPNPAPSPAANSTSPPSSIPTEPTNPELSPTTSAGVGPESVPAENEPVPRDNIPD